MSKLFQVSVIALLVLILGAILGTYWSVPYGDLDEDDILELAEEELGIPYFDSDHFTFSRFSFEEFSTEVNHRILTEDDVIEFGEENDYEVFQEEDFIELIKEECNEELCIEDIIEAYPEDRIIERTLVTFDE